ISVRISGNASLPNVNAASRHVKEMVDDAGADERVTVTVEIHAPRVAGSVSKNFELFRAWMIARNGGINFNPGTRSFRNLHTRMREYSVRHVKPAIGPPGEAV